LENNKKQIEQKNYKGILIFGVEIIHKIMVQEKVTPSSCTRFHSAWNMWDFCQFSSEAAISIRHP